MELSAIDMEKWQAISRDELEKLIEEQLDECSSEQKTVFEQFRVPLHRAKIARFGGTEEVFVVAKKGSEAMYYEDVEEGFNFSVVSDQGETVEPGANQDELKYALLRWSPRCS